MPFSKAHRRGTIALLAIIATINASAVTYVVDTTHSISDQNCRTNDKQNKILATLVAESLKGADHPPAGLTDQQKHAIIVFRKKLAELRKPTCST